MVNVPEHLKVGKSGTQKGLAFFTPTHFAVQAWLNNNPS
jgi:hypothetical protein